MGIFSSFLAWTLSTAWAADTRVPLLAATAPSNAVFSPTMELPLKLPGAASFYLRPADAAWVNLGAIEFDVAWPADAPTNAQILVHTKDWDHLWYQKLMPGYLLPGAVNRYRVDLTPLAADWEPREHQLVWNIRSLQEPKEFGVRVFGNATWSGTARMDRVTGIVRADNGAPWIRNVRPSTNEPSVFGKFELSFELPDRYPNPFDPDQVVATASFRQPDGKTVTIDAFYSVDFVRRVTALGEQLIPQGPPCWRARFTPTAPGTYQYSLKVRDTRGEAQWGPATFHATAPPASHGFVRVSVKDARYFEYSDGAPFFAIGHNIRSPFDTRMDSQFPWLQRWPEGSKIYARYFKSMHENGENVAEIWTAAWSLGLEWNPRWRGYHGVGQYNMMHAWELDRVVEEAARNGIHINLVIHNHGKFSAFSDPEWEYNPFNVKNGGYLDGPDEYFTDPRALGSFRNLMRYMIARWGYSPNILAWQLWSELDLTGAAGGEPKLYRRPEVADWHRIMGRAIKDMDPNDHLVSTHVCGDYTHQEDNIVTLREIDHCAVDAYHNNEDPIFIVDLMKRTARHNNAYGKPVLITEFGGSSRAQDVRHIDDALHAGLWASTCLPLGGTPFLWWWQLIEEENFYPRYATVQRFLNGEDRRDRDMIMYTPLVESSNVAGPLGIECLKSPRRAYAWLYHTDLFDELDPAGKPISTNVVLTFQAMDSGTYDVEFWNTFAGQPITNVQVRVEGEDLRVGVPPFARDIAMKVKPASRPRPQKSQKRK